MNSPIERIWAPHERCEVDYPCLDLRCVYVKGHEDVSSEPHRLIQGWQDVPLLVPKG